MAIISIINQKGGCGKTTTAVNIATGLARSGFRVLLVDMDPQGHATLGLGLSPDKLKKTIFDLLEHREKEVDTATVLLQPLKRLTLAPANVFLSAFEQSMAGKPSRESRLAMVLAKIKNRYDHIIIDCPPSLGLLTINSLLASSHAVIPIDSGFYALSGVKKLEETIEMLRKKVNHSIELRHVITFYDTKSSFNKDFLSDLRKMVGTESIFESRIRRSIKFNISQRLGCSVMDMGSKKGGIAYKDYYRLIKEVIDWTRKSSNYRISLLNVAAKVAQKKSTTKNTKVKVG
jgi:chromosome partitioning protein